ncbi:type II toxin-antitoxin system VapC family toxin [Archaeoglobus fulgidus]|uniref:type II toxin-antitoxin system VapC family toxin n=1 Tax=Archaeoglobus fulgidus TaxID=2234 RepID=UPI000AE38128|nr:type II toxin-antitoxin system VapC family toxin [Archaeoglobus fulgidus]
MNSIEGLTVFVPKIFVIELISVAKRLGIEISRKDIEELTYDFEILSEDFVFDEALNVAEKVHPRAADSYFIATARLTNSILISSDRLMVRNGKKYGIEAYCLLDELEKALEAIGKLKGEG